MFPCTDCIDFPKSVKKIWHFNVHQSLAHCHIQKSVMPMIMMTSNVLSGIVQNYWQFPQAIHLKEIDILAILNKDWN